MTVASSRFAKQSWRQPAGLLALLIISTIFLFNNNKLHLGALKRSSWAQDTEFKQDTACGTVSADAGQPPAKSGGRMCAAAPLPPNVFFVIQAYNFMDTSGGITVLHYLADRLNRAYGTLEPVAFLSDTSITNPAYASPLLPAWRNASESIAVYTEVQSGNKLGSSRVIRWMLWFPGGHGGGPASAYDPKDFIACYTQGFCKLFGPEFTVRPLRIIDYGFDYLYNLPVAANRSGTIVYYGKKQWWRQNSTAAFPEQRNYSGLKKPTNATILKRHGPRGHKRTRMEMFAKAETFVSYDAATWRSVEAALAGAKSIVVPVENVSREEWAQSMYGAEEIENGIAYGEEDLPRALATQHLLLPTLKRRAVEQEREVKEFVAEVCKFFKLPCKLEPC